MHNVSVYDTYFAILAEFKRKIVYSRSDQHLLTTHA
jgi:hypothetical protein